MTIDDPTGSDAGGFEFLTRDGIVSSAEPVRRPPPPVTSDPFAVDPFPAEPLDGLPPPPAGLPLPPAPSDPARRSQPRRIKARQVQRVVTRIDPMAMLRVSLAFALCLWMIIVVAGIVMWQVAVVTGSIGKVEDFLAQLLAENSFTIDGLRVFEGAAVAGFVLFVCGALFAVVTSVLYNLIASVFGGLRVTVVELETAQSVAEL